MKSLLYIILLGTLAVLTLGASCEERLIQLPVVGFVEQTFPVNSSNGSFNTTDSIDFTEELARLREENAFEGIIAISLESVTFTILNNASAAGSLINGAAQASSTSLAELETVIELTDLDLDAVENIEQIPTLENAGVAEINQAIDIDTGTNEIHFSVNGTVAPAPPPNLNFDIRVKVAFTIVGEIATEVPVI